MAASKIVRQTMLQFGGALAASGNIAIFGSLAAGSIGYSLQPVTIQSLIQYAQGWSAAVFGNNAPAKQDRNALDYLFSYQLGYILQAGIPEWDAATPYFAQASFCQVAGVIYTANTNNTGINPVTDVNSSGVGTNWTTLFAQIASQVAPPSQGICKAWVYFSGLNGAIISSFGVSSITVNGTGDYTINWTPAVTASLADANYLVQTSTSNDLNTPYDPFGRWNGDLKSITQLRVRNLQGNTFAGWGGNVENYVAIFH
jgi:hypothetical protein